MPSGVEDDQSLGFARQRPSADPGVLIARLQVGQPGRLPAAFHTCVLPWFNSRTAARSAAAAKAGRQRKPSSMAWRLTWLKAPTASTEKARGSSSVATRSSLASASWKAAENFFGQGARDKASEHVSDHQCADAAVGLYDAADSCKDGRWDIRVSQSPGCPSKEAEARVTSQPRS